ncbi:hypothetical protein [Streptosporangium roseum]|uniref:Uncharacterized protein n=1 Tax=Streptosporangium roseum (strain ATCC 12428 / DSM 43021 / JCM 3005 / KCTC 9067 / NCIMB 10171 / NRRL 2505 / NI 9100) TaxID=479432 RepID=D2AS51_STRRD|nr:hypothetical protein [Streptosporangium roseum]ACZ86578.1 hypothetical protein Sros_3649 [Streptosporangium roseum DSM 43021]
MLDTILPAVFIGLFVCFLLFFVATLIKTLRQRRVLKYTAPMRAMDIIGRVRQFKVRGQDEEAVLLVQSELAMPADEAPPWVKSI